MNLTVIARVESCLEKPTTGPCCIFASAALLVCQVPSLHRNQLPASHKNGQQVHWRHFCPSCQANKGGSRAKAVQRATWKRHFTAFTRWVSHDGTNSCTSRRCWPCRKHWLRLLREKFYNANRHCSLCRLHWISRKCGSSTFVWLCMVCVSQLGNCKCVHALVYYAVIKDFGKRVGADGKQVQGLVRLAKKNGEKLGFLA